jgi:hypothetical protein
VEEKDRSLKIHYSHIAISCFGFGLLGLALAIPGYLHNWHEYKICRNIFGITSCENKPFLAEDSNKPKGIPKHVYTSDAGIKIAAITIACIAFPIASFAAAKAASIKEYQETVEEINKKAELESIAQERATDLKLGSEAYQAMKAIEMADLVDRFRETFYIPISIENDEETQALPTNSVNQKKLSSSSSESFTISENAKKLLFYLQRKEATVEKPMSVNTVNKNEVIKDANASTIRGLFWELVNAELAEFDEDGNIYLTRKGVYS